MKRIVSLSAAACLSACFQGQPSAAEPRAGLPAGWAITSETPDRIEARKGEGGYVEITAQTATFEAEQYTPAEWEVIDGNVLAEIASRIAGSCPGLDAATLSPLSGLNGARISSPENDCTVISARTDTRAVAGFGANFKGTPGETRTVLDALARRLLNAAPARQLLNDALAQAKANSAAPSATVAAPGGAGEARMKAALGAVKPEHRPLGFASSLTEWNPVAMMMDFQWWQLLPNGLAVAADCGVGARAADCDTARYTRRGNTVSLAVDSETLFDETIRPFPAGARIDVDVGNVGGGAVMNTSVLSGGQLRLTKSGEIAIADWTGTSTDGGSYGVYTRAASGIRGRYYLDGYLIAIEDAASGQISVGTLFEKIEGRDRYLYLNGELYWEE
jgi:hypothetical protein